MLNDRIYQPSMHNSLVPILILHLFTFTFYSGSPKDFHCKSTTVNFTFTLHWHKKSNNMHAPPFKPGESLQVGPVALGTADL